MKSVGFGIYLGAAVLLVATGMAQTQKAALSVTAAAVYSEVRSGEEVYVKVTFTNNMNRAVALEFSIPLCDYVLEVRDGDGNLAPDSEVKSNQRCDERFTGGHGIVQLKPNESLTSTISANMFSNMSRPGEYSVQVAWREPKELGGVLVKSNRVKITVIP